MNGENPKLDVMAVGAHPDDVEIACGGTLAKLAAHGYRVGVVDLTDGEPTPWCPHPDVRVAEAQEAARVLGLATRVVLDLPNRRLFDGFEARVALARQFRKFRPRIVIGMGGKTSMASPDHYQAMLITDAAVFYSRLSKWDEYFGELPVHAIASQLYYRLGFDPVSPDGSGSHFTVDIGDTLETKLAAVRSYRSQFPAEKAHIFDRIRGAAMLAGAAAGFSAGETFVTARPLGTQDLVQHVLGPGTERPAPRATG
ncbi:MAG: LmbE family protein [Planctomycetes bacterium]|nr:LmbE family protein [Planctomycetota bacterium]